MREPLFFESIVGNPQMLQQGSVGWEFLLESERSRFRQFNEARTLFRFFQNQLEIQDVFGEVSQLADDIIVSSMSEAIAAFPKQAGNGLVLLAVGKAGGRELTIGSDLDLMFIDASAPSTRKPVSDEIPRHFLALVSETHPPAYRVDLRLRPEFASCFHVALSARLF
jgi:glutamine synthetase adenylyltransferase